MSNQLEKLIKVVYKKWKAVQLKEEGRHPDEESWACFLEGKVSREESESLKTHLLSCDICAEAFAIQMRLKPGREKDVPEDLREWMRNLVVSQDKPSILEVFILLKEKALEILHTTGDVLVGQEVIPARLLRSRKMHDFKDEVTILKDFKDIRVELKLENKAGEVFDLIVLVKDKQTQAVIKDLRVSLLKDDLELESYLTTSERVVFEHVLAGKYIVQIANIESRIASIILDIKT
jgi:hypothetical protein